MKIFVQYDEIKNAKVQQQRLAMKNYNIDFFVIKPSEVRFLPNSA